ncbi:hypothetical protein PAXRUDRAFT_144450 [Paxillus rubicundulus Ve08.2h10]|uniref:Tc1-like transposase DDE domain-containing protein n=1 Tax=Paxillus rubicundulus Ve08.2h10 TaxID=930991 RepID=A0A0D0D9I4_9AGAM|nr:hypothetical protein PAXRUDRAFT_144450 [Paxillus rubicundulus Ve08.2h10]
MLLFIDKAAKDKWTSTCQHGWSRKGLHCCVSRCFIQGTRFPILPAITLNGIIAYDIIEGPANSQHFVRFLEEHVMPLTNPYPGPCSVIIMDNCHIHKTEEVCALIEDMHCMSINTLFFTY